MWRYRVTKWEYTTKRSLGIVLLDGELNVLGAEGWELVALTNNGSSSHPIVTAYFKRPIKATRKRTKKEATKNDK